jgi:hypothetical protein
MIEQVQSHPSGTDAEQLSRLLELELVQKRATWKQASQRNRSLRSAAFLFLFLLMAGCLFGFFFVFTQVSEQRPSHPPPTSNH